MSDNQAAAAEPCDHHWVHHVRNGASAKVCSQCHAPDLDAIKVYVDAVEYLLSKHSKGCYDPQECYCTPLRKAMEHGF